MSTRMLIDARHPEETRVTVVKGSRVEDFDYESATRRQLKGNIYLARVTRVEPSLQAAFVEYGGNRHGFLAFSEIHPDYYQIPLEDREAIIEDETKAAAAEKEAEDSEETETKKRRPRRRRGRKPATEAVGEVDATVSEDVPEKAEDNNAKKEPDANATENVKIAKDEDDGVDSKADKITDDVKAVVAENTNDDDGNDDDAEATEVKESDEEEKDAEIEAVAASRRSNERALKRRYSIQEVIKRRQVLLIQVVKEERGNKGAALTTYMSLAGRYCVLMPNSTHSGGISRKISNLSDRKKLKQVINSLEVPDGMGLIVRTAGINRTKTEIKRDYDYLLRLWNGIRDLTLKSTAPALIYEEGSLIKRTIRDVYSRDIDEVWVEGERGYRAAKDFMKLLMPSHAKKVQHYKDRIPLYQRYQVENQLEAMYQPVVQLRSGGYIVINPTEALISIDVNSGRATKEHNIEETAVKTNLEAAEEVARQLRLRDMAGLVVIDYIDMEDRGNNRAVERRMKEVLKGDRARIQVGRISSFGLMEMSRQRLRPNLLEVAMETCGHCAGTGLVRSVESAAIMTLRQLEEEGIRNRSSLIRAKVNPEVAIYLLNQKRAVLSDLEREYKLTIHIVAEISMAPSDVEITQEANAETKVEPRSEGVVVKMDSSDAEMEESAEKAIEQKTRKDDKGATDEEEQPRRKRRRRRRRRRSGSDDVDATSSDNTAAGETDISNAETKSEGAPADGDERKSESRRRRGSRGGRRRRGKDGAKDADQDQAAATNNDTATSEPKSGAATPDASNGGSADSESENKPVRRRRRVRKSSDDTSAETSASIGAESGETGASGEAKAPAKRTSRRRTPAKDATDKAANDTEAAKDAGDKQAETGSKPVSKRRRSVKSDTSINETSSGAEKQPDAPKRARATKADASAKKAGTKTAKEAGPTKPAEEGEPAGPKRSGWWQRTFG